MDVHVPYAITIGLRLRGVDVITAQEDGSRELEDADLLNRARSLGRIMFTRDDDLLREAALLAQRGFPKQRSEEHTSELQSRLHLVCRLLLEKKKKTVRCAASSEARDFPLLGPEDQPIGLRELSFWAARFLPAVLP